MTSRRPVIVLDPGHGGSHAAGGSSPNNARGPNGLLEKDLTLDLARRAAGLLAADAEVFLTRTGDANLPLADRAHAARDRRADVFLSIHMNGFQDPATDGTEVWTARSPSPASRGLARAVLQRLLAVTGVADRGVREKNLGVLLASRHAPNTAASLAEIAFLTNPAHARRLEDDGYRQRIAAAMAESIREALRAPAATGQGFEPQSRSIPARAATAPPTRAVTTILVESDATKIQDWTEYVKEYDRETCKTPALDLAGLGDPEVARGETLEEVLDLMAANPARVALIYAHANAHGLIMRITASSNSAQSKYLRGISRVWKAMDEIIALRSGRESASGQREFFIDVPAAVALFRRLLVELRTLDGELAGRLADPATATDRAQADAWFDQWVELMAKACLGRGLGETDLRRVCRAMQKVRDARFERVEIRACNIGKDRENLNALKELFGAGSVVAPKVTMFFGKAAVNVNPGGNLDQLARELGGFRGRQFAAPGTRNHRLNGFPNGEPEVATGRRNRIFPAQGPGDAILQVTQDHPFHFQCRLFATTNASLTRFVQAGFKGNHTPSATAPLPVGGMWTAKDSTVVKVPFLLPLETDYRDFLETSA